MRDQYKKYDVELLKNNFLEKHSECLPFVGELYEKNGLLLIGESHYVHQDDICFVDREDFYDISYDTLENGNHGYKDWINTRNVFESRAYGGYDFKKFFSNPTTEMAKLIYHTNAPSKDQKIASMQYYAFMNYFKRPAYDKGKTIQGLSEKDYQYAYDISKYIIEVLNPKLIIFISKKAYNAFYESDLDSNLRLKYTLKCVSHPSSRWWNRKRKKDERSAKEDFYDYLKEFL